MSAHIPECLEQLLCNCIFFRICTSVWLTYFGQLKTDEKKNMEDKICVKVSLDVFREVRRLTELSVKFLCVLKKLK